MNAVTLAELIGLAGIVAANPLPVVGQLTLAARPAGVGMAAFFAAGWAGAVLVLSAVLSLGATVLLSAWREPAASWAGGAVVPLVVGLGVAAVGILLVRKATRTTDATPHRLSRAFADVTRGRAFFVGAGLAVVKPKSLVAIVAASAVIGAEGRTVASAVLLLIVFTAVASAAVVVPVIMRAAGGPRSAAVLSTLQTFVERHFVRWTGIAMIVIGGLIVLSGVGRLFVG